MSAGGHLSAMLSALKNNSRGKRTAFSREEGILEKKQDHSLPKHDATPEQLAAIRKELTAYKAQQAKKQKVLLAIAFGLLASLILAARYGHIPHFLKEFW